MAGVVAGRDTTRASPCSRSVVEIWNVGSSTVARKMSSEKNSSAKMIFSTKSMKSLACLMVNSHFKRILFDTRVNVIGR